MASVTNVTLTTNHNRQTRLVSVTVNFTATFSGYEVNQMNAGLHYIVHCTLRGDDPFRDDRLFNFPTQHMPVLFGTPSGEMSGTFAITLGDSMLDEDIGRDEVYARVTLHNTYTDIKRSGKSNTVRGRF